MGHNTTAKEEGSARARNNEEGYTSARHFIFCTGIENSYPIVTNSKTGQVQRRDGMELSEHYKHWNKDFQLVKEMGITFLRYGPPLYKQHLGPMKYDWSWSDKTFPRLRELGIHPITDLCHFGVPDWVEGCFQNPEWPELFADYCREFAKRYPWVRCYTPVNEIYIAAGFSAKQGWWNEQLTTDRAFVTAMKHLCRANLLAEQAILEVQPDALFIQSESSEYFHAGGPDAQRRADFHNQMRFVALDLSYGYDVTATMYEFLADHGLSRAEYHWFLEHGSAMRPRCVMGNDYYATNEHEVIGPDGPIQPSGEVFGYYVITKQYFDRYHLPVMHTETNRKNVQEAPAWLWKEWSNIVRLKHDGVPILGFTWYSLIDQTDWDTALREFNYRVNPCGLYDKSRKIHPVGKAYQELIAKWGSELPLQSMSRDIHLSENDRQSEKPKTPGQTRADHETGAPIGAGKGDLPSRKASRPDTGAGRGPAAGSVSQDNNGRKKANNAHKVR